MAELTEEEIDATRIWGLHPQVFGFVASLPLVLPVLILVSDLDGWTVALSYGAFGIFFAAIILGWIGYLIAELVLRKRFSNARKRAPVFAITAFFAVIALPFFIIAMEPLVLMNPKWSRVSQVVRWTTSKENEEYGGYHRFILVMTGRGNLKQHTMTSGWLNWTGDERAGFSGVNASEMEVSVPGKGWKTDDYPATPSVLRERLAHSGLPDEEVGRISDEILLLMGQAKRKESLGCATGEMDPMAEMVWDNEAEVLGIWLWILFVFGSFQLLARVSLPREGESGDRPLSSSVD